MHPQELKQPLKEEKTQNDKFCIKHKNTALFIQQKRDRSIKGHSPIA